MWVYLDLLGRLGPRLLAPRSRPPTGPWRQFAVHHIAGPVAFYTFVSSLTLAVFLMLLNVPIPIILSYAGMFVHNSIFLVLIWVFGQAASLIL